MERIVENEWVELEATAPIEFATDNFGIIHMFSKKLNKIAMEATLQTINSTLRDRKNLEKGILPEECPKHTSGLLFPGDMIYAYNYCLNADRPVYLIMSNVGITYTMQDAYRWKHELGSHLKASDNSSVRGFYEYRNVKGNDHIACMRELSYEEFSSIVE